jgi:hypothetical protein
MDSQQKYSGSAEFSSAQFPADVPSGTGEAHYISMIFIHALTPY